jgi:predicted esterase
VQGTPIEMIAGNRHKCVAPEAVAAYVDKLVAAGCPARPHGFDGGHRVDNGVLARLEAIAQEQPTKWGESS